MTRKILAISIIFFMLFVVVPSWNQTVSATDYGAWSYYRQVWVDQTNVDVDLVNFPVLVTIADAIGDLCKADGGDIRFSSSDNNTVYPYEIEKWVDGSNRLVWTKIPRIDDAVNTTFWFHYGNAAAPTLTNYTNVWNANYVGVWHMNDSGTSAIIDSTTTNADGTKKAANEPLISTAGEVGDCQYFDGANDYITTLDAPFDFLTNDYQIYAWVYSDDHPAAGEAVVAKGDYDALANDFIFYIYSDKAYFSSNTGVNAAQYLVTPHASWRNVVCGIEGDNIRLYVNGTLNNAVAGHNADNINNAHTLNFGADQSLNQNFDGKLDEVRISNLWHNASWIKAEWSSVNVPTTFIQIGFERTTLTNNPPVNVNPFPVVGTTGNILSPRLIITIADPDGDTMNTTFKTNVTGVWGVIGINSSVLDGTYSWVNDSMNEYRTRYWWNVSTNDGMGGWDNDTYWFSTYSGILVSSYYPVNHSLNQLKNITYHVHLIHTNGTTMNISCYRDNGTIYRGEYLNIGNGTYYFFSNASLSNTFYWWWFNITDNKTWYNSTQWYKTGTSSGGGVLLIGNGDISIGSYMVTGIIIGLSFGGLLCIRTWRKRRQKDVKL